MKIGEFDGPLDLLVGLIEQRKMHVNDVSLAQVTDDYMTYTQEMTQFSLAEVSQFVLVAATLLLIKSRSLLPNLELTDEEESDVHELERRLKHYQLIKRGARALMSAWGTCPLREPKKAPIRVTPHFSPGETTASILMESLRKLVSALPTMAFRETVHVETTVTLEEMIDRLKDRVMRAARTRFKDLTSNASKVEVVIHFLALLELVKGGFVSAAQDKPFSDILMEPEQADTPRYGV